MFRIVELLKVKPVFTDEVPSGKQKIAGCKMQKRGVFSTCYLSLSVIAMPGIIHRVILTVHLKTED